MGAPHWMMLPPGVILRHHFHALPATRLEAFGVQLQSVETWPLAPAKTHGEQTEAAAAWREAATYPSVVPHCRRHPPVTRSQTQAEDHPRPGHCPPTHYPPNQTRQTPDADQRMRRCWKGPHKRSRVTVACSCSAQEQDSQQNSTAPATCCRDGRTRLACGPRGSRLPARNWVGEQVASLHLCMSSGSGLCPSRAAAACSSGVWPHRAPGPGHETRTAASPLSRPDWTCCQACFQACYPQHCLPSSILAVSHPLSGAPSRLPQRAPQMCRLPLRTRCAWQCSSASCGLCLSGTLWLSRHHCHRSQRCCREPLGNACRLSSMRPSGYKCRARRGQGSSASGSPPALPHLGLRSCAWRPGPC
mmetsp:Transcript_70316/g.161316  ORF Transcript_70316/g.161316 Transcript_70316/m.161316 type:complete len:360 (+) Transcript_70316:673-1752(+)